MLKATSFSARDSVRTELTHFWEQTLEKLSYFRKAFDLVDHHILVAKLLSLGVKPSVVNWIIDFLRGRQQRVKVNGVFCDWLDFPAGVPQGTRFGPF